MAQKTIKIKVTEYEYQMLEDMKCRIDKLNDGELSLAGDILLSNMAE